MRRRIGLTLAACALLTATVLSAGGCASNQPPAGTYTQPVLNQYNATPLKQAILALSQTAITMNAATGATHLSDANTMLVRDFALQASASIDAWVAGSSSTLSTVVSGFTTLTTQLSQDVKNTTLKADLSAVAALLTALPPALQEE